MPASLIRSRVAIGAVLAAIAAVTFAHAAQRQQPAAATAPFDPTEKSIPELQRAMERGVVTSKALVAASLARIQAYDQSGPRLNAMIALNLKALDIAAALDRERAEGHVRGPLHGIPVVVKDNFETADMPTTAGSIALAGFETGRDAFQVKRLRDAGAVIVGKTNLHELASGITTISSFGGQTANPYDVTRNPGGSSGGTGAAVAASFAAAGLGSDTCGSIRIPSSHNNLFGLRGTAGLSSRSGIIPLSSTQDIGGPLARTVTDLAIVLDATVGPDPADPVTRANEGHIPRSYRDALRGDALKGARIGVLRELFGDAPEDAEVAGIVRKALDAMKQQGAELVDVSIPALDDLLQGSSAIDAEFRFDLMDYLAKAPRAPVKSLDDILERGLYHASLDASFKRRNAVASRDTDQARRARIKRDAARQVVLAAFEEHRVIALVYPTLRRKPAIIGEPQRGANCQLSPTTGLPVVAVPAGFTDDGLPIGMDVLGRAFAEPDLLSIAYAYEQSVHPRRPPLMTPALVNGAAPKPVTSTVVARDGRLTATTSITFDPTSQRLTYRTLVSGTNADALLAVTLHRGSADDRGPAIARLLAPGMAVGAGEIALSGRDVEALHHGQLSIVVMTGTHRDGSIRAPIHLSWPDR